MINNFKSLNIKTYKCKEQISNWLQKEKNIPLLGLGEEYFYFVYNENLINALNLLPNSLTMYILSQDI